MNDPPGIRRFRVRIYEDDYELLTHRLFLAVLDLGTPHGLRAAEAELAAMLPSLAAQARVKGDRLRSVRLAVHEWGPDGEHVLDWVAR